MLRDELIKYYYPPNGYNYNCAESMIRAINDYYDLKLPEQVFNAVSGFGGGAHHDELCGGIVGIIDGLSLLYAHNGRGHDSPELRQITAEFFQRFDAVFSTTRCNQLKKENAIPIRKCEPVLTVCADILEDLIREYPIINQF